MYEYMAAGLPFICSDFPGWRIIAEKSQAGICVAPDDVKLIGEKIKGLLFDREKAQQMGKKGRDYVISHCSWDSEEKGLLLLYHELRG